MNYNSNFYYPPPGYENQKPPPPGFQSRPIRCQPPAQRYSIPPPPGFQQYPPPYIHSSNYSKPPLTFPYSKPPPQPSEKLAAQSITLSQPAIPGCSTTITIIPKIPPPPGFSSPPDKKMIKPELNTEVKKELSDASTIYDFPPPSFNIPPPSIVNFNFFVPPPLPPPSSSNHPGNYSSYTPYSYTSNPPTNIHQPPPTVYKTSNKSNAASTFSSSNRSNYGDKQTRAESSASSSRSIDSNQQLSERDKLLYEWRRNYCETSDNIARKLAELENQEEKEYWIRSSPADTYYTRNNDNMIATPKLDALCTLFEQELIKRGEQTRSEQTPYEPVSQKKHKHKFHHCRAEKCSSSESSDDEFELKEDCSMEELTKKINHPYRLHADLWHNEIGEMNDGPLCRCSAKSRRSGIRHGIYPGEKNIPKCDLNSNNLDKLHHYRYKLKFEIIFFTI